MMTNLKIQIGNCHNISVHFQSMEENFCKECSRNFPLFVRIMGLIEGFYNKLLFINNDRI